MSKKTKEVASASATNTAETKSRFKKEIEETPSAGFVKFENVGESKEGFIVGTKKISNDKGDKKHYVMKIDGVEWILPNNYQLQNKLDNLVKTKGGTIPAKGIEVHIEYIGTQKIEGQQNEMKCFKLLTV